MYHTELLTVLARKWEFLPGKRIISIGRYNEQKGYDRLIEAWGKVNRKHPDWHIRIYGEGQDRDRLQELIGKHHIENSFSLCPPTKTFKKIPGKFHIRHEFTI